MGLKNGGLRSGGLRNASSIVAVPDSGLQHRYDATEITATDGDTISTWSDEQGDDDLTAGTEPIYKDSVINGNPVVRHDGVDDKLNTAFSSAQSNPFHVFLVGQLQETNTDNNYYLDGNDANDFEIGLVEGNSQTWDWYDGTNNPSGSASDFNPHIFDLLVDGSNSELQIDGVSDITGTHDETDLSGLTTGVRADDFGYSEFDHGEILIYDASVAGFNASDVRSYLSDKWGIAI